MHFDSFSTMAGRHLVYAYAIVFLVQAGYLLWIIRNWMKRKPYDAKNQRS